MRSRVGGGLVIFKPIIVVVHIILGTDGATDVIGSAPVPCWVVVSSLSVRLQGREVGCNAIPILVERRP
jgi:hypothetical protein